MENLALYLFTLLLAAVLTRISLPVLKRFVAPFLLDTPNTLKKHTAPTPVLGGTAIYMAAMASLVIIRLITNFPTGTLHRLRGILMGGTLIFCLGILDDLRKPEGVPMKIKLLTQMAAAAALIFYGVHIEVIQAPYLSYPLTFLWLLTLTNAFNLLDIQDGLCVSQAIVCTLGLTLITLPSEFIYVNFAALALLGACLAFWPCNHAQQKIFLGDSGSTFLGFMIAALSMGAGYSTQVDYGFLAPLFIVAIPLFDTFFVALARLLKGKNPLKGSDDHLALRLLRAGWPLRKILISFMFAATLCNLGAFAVTRASLSVVFLLFVTAAVFFSYVTYRGLSCK